MRKISFCEIYSFRTLFSWARPITTFSLEFISFSKNVKKKYNMIEINLVQGLKIKIKLTQKLLNFLTDSVLKKEKNLNC